MQKLLDLENSHYNNKIIYYFISELMMEKRHKDKRFAQDDIPAVHKSRIPPDPGEGTSSAPCSPHRLGLQPDTDEATNSTPHSPLLGGTRLQTEGAATSSTPDLPLLS